MKTVLVTGSDGFIGKNLSARLDQEKDITVLGFNKSNTSEELKDFVEKSDFVFHLAGVNRPKDESEFDVGNRELTQKILEVIEKTGKKIPVLLTSSKQAELDNPYGKSKKAAEEAVFQSAKKTGGNAYVYRLPNVFGKWCKPNYNSVVATFCNNIANGLKIKIDNPEAELTLVYIDDVIDDFLEAMRGRKKTSADGFCRVPREHKISLKELAEKLYSFRNSRDSLLIPDFESEFDRFLYATYTSYLAKDSFSYSLEMKQDDRGWLAEFIKSQQFGQVFISRTRPGITRGNHWHHTKIEKILVLEGEADINFRNYDSNEKFSYHVNGSELKVIDIPAGYTHSIINTGDTDLLTLFWSDEIFNPDAPDTNYEEV